MPRKHPHWLSWEKRGAFLCEHRAARFNNYRLIETIQELAEDIFYDLSDWRITEEHCTIEGCGCEPYYRIERYNDGSVDYWFARGLEADVLWSRWLSTRRTAYDTELQG